MGIWRRDSRFIIEFAHQNCSIFTILIFLLHIVDIVPSICIKNISILMLIEIKKNHCCAYIFFFCHKQSYFWHPLLTVLPSLILWILVPRKNRPQIRNALGMEILEVRWDLAPVVVPLKLWLVYKLDFFALL